MFHHLFQDSTESGVPALLHNDKDNVIEAGLHYSDVSFIVTQHKPISISYLHVYFSAQLLTIPQLNARDVRLNYFQ